MKIPFFSYFLCSIKMHRRSEEKIKLQEVRDSDSFWSLINLHHGPIFSRTSAYYGAFTLVLIISAVLTWLFCCGGLTRCLSHFNNTAATVNQAAGSILPTHLMPSFTQPMHHNYNPTPLQPTNFGGQQIGYPPIKSNPYK